MICSFSPKCEIYNFAGDLTLVVWIFSNLIQDMENVYEWCVYNSTKANSDKFEFIILGNTGSHTLQVGDITIKSAASVTLLDIRIDSKLNFKEHVNNIVKKAYVCP